MTLEEVVFSRLLPRFERSPDLPAPPATSMTVEQAIAHMRDALAADAEAKEAPPTH